MRELPAKTYHSWWYKLDKQKFNDLDMFFPPRPTFFSSAYIFWAVMQSKAVTWLLLFHFMSFCVRLPFAICHLNECRQFWAGDVAHADVDVDVDVVVICFDWHLIYDWQIQTSRSSNNRAYRKISKSSQTEKQTNSQSDRPYGRISA